MHFLQVLETQVWDEGGCWVSFFRGLSPRLADGHLPRVVTSSSLPYSPLLVKDSNQIELGPPKWTSLDLCYLFRVPGGGTSTCDCLGTQFSPTTPCIDCSLQDRKFLVKKNSLYRCSEDFLLNGKYFQFHFFPLKCLNISTQIFSQVISSCLHPERLSSASIFTRQTH